MNLEDLKMEIPYKWKIQRSGQWGTQCVAYIDARDAMELLDRVCGIDGWQDEYYAVNGQTYCKVGINIVRVSAQWVWKSDCGTEAGAGNPNATDEVKFKGQASDAFKRACVKWGIGRFLYSMDFVWLRSIKDNNGKWMPIHDPMSKSPCPKQLLKDLGIIKNVDKYIREVLKK